MGAPYDNNLALRLADACQLAYDQFEGTLTLPPGYNISAELSTVLFGESEKIGFLMSSASDHVLAFRGTDSFLDWLANATYVQTAFPYVGNAGQTHGGFMNVYRSMRDQLLTALQAAPAKPLFITGHSLGGGKAGVHGNIQDRGGTEKFASFLVFLAPFWARLSL